MHTVTSCDALGAMLGSMERPKQLPVSAIAYRSQLQDGKMAACFMIKNPQDAPICVTGLSANNAAGHSPRSLGAELPHQAPTQPPPDRRHSDKPPGPATQQAPGNKPAERYCPVLAVTRRSVPPTTAAAGGAATHHRAVESPPWTLVDGGVGHGEGPALGPTADARDRPRPNHQVGPPGRRSAPWALRRPVPPLISGGAPKSKSAFATGAAASKSSLTTSSSSSSALGFLARSKVDLRTGFMRSLSRPTPGELDLKQRRDAQASSARAGRRGRAGEDQPPDLDKLNMTEIMRMLRNKSAGEERPATVGHPPPDAAATPRGVAAAEAHGRLRASVAECQDMLALDDRHRQPAGAGRDAARCEPPLVSSKQRSTEHKLRLQALYSNQGQQQQLLADPRGRHPSRSSSSERSPSSTPRERRPRQPGQEKRMRVNVLSLEARWEDEEEEGEGEEGEGEGDESAGPDIRTSSSESCSEHSGGSASCRDGARRPVDSDCPRVNARHPTLSNRGGRSGRKNRSARRVRYAEPLVAPSSGGGGGGWDDRAVPWRSDSDGSRTGASPGSDLEPSHRPVTLAEYVPLAHPLRPPANSPVSVVSEDGDGDRAGGGVARGADAPGDGPGSDRWSVSYHSRRTTATTPTNSSVSGLVKGQVRVQAHGANKATLDIFLPQMTS